MAFWFFLFLRSTGSYTTMFLDSEFASWGNRMCFFSSLSTTPRLTRPFVTEHGPDIERGTPAVRHTLLLTV